MNFKDYEKKLNEIDLEVRGEFVTTARGDVVAQMNPYGGFETKDFRVAHILSQPIEKKKTTRKRARTEDGQFIADDPSTPEVNEAWTEE